MKSIMAVLAVAAVAFAYRPATPGATGLSDAVLDQAVPEIAARVAPARLGVGVMDLQSGDTWFWNADQRFPMQSLFKAPLGAAVLAAVDQGRISLDEILDVDEDDLAPPYSEISAAWPERRTYTVRDLLERAVGGSDNTAADLLARRLGGPPAVTAWLRDHGVNDLRIDRLEREFQVEIGATGPFRPDWRTNDAFTSALEAVPLAERRRALEAYLSDPRDTSTPRAAVAFLAKLQREELLSAASTARLLRIMQETGTGRDRLKAGLPAGSLLAHKTGTGRPVLGVSPAVNDMGVATLPDGRRIIIVALLSGAALSEPESDAVLAEIARAAVRSLR